jgi:hypothetical protein
MSLAQRLAMGHEMVTDSPERLMQMRWWASDNAIKQIRLLRQLSALGHAYESGTELTPKWVPDEWGEDQYHTADGRSYYIHPEAKAVINNAFDRSSVYKSAAGPIFKFLQAIKGTAAAKLSLSLFHPIHIVGIRGADVLADASRRFMQGQGTWLDAWHAATNVVSSVPQTIADWRRYGTAVQFLQGRGTEAFGDLPNWMQQDITDFTDMGLNAGISHERQLQFARSIANTLEDNISLLRQTKALSGAVNAATLGYKLFTLEPMQKWLFGEWIPSIKFASAMMRRDTLKMERPDLFRPEARQQRLLEYQKIGRDIEGRYGEMFYDNLLWNNTAKQVGQSMMLSLSWQLGMFRVAGDAIHDGTKVITHWDEIVHAAKKGGASAATAKALTNRLQFGAFYAAKAALFGAMVTAGAGFAVKSIWDMIFPKIGVQPDGSDKRIATPFWTKEPGMFEHYAENDPSSYIGAALHMAGNKMQPMLSSILQAASNKDYRGRTITSDPNFLTAMWPKVAYVLKNSLMPISVENISQTAQTPADVIMDFLGFNQSGKWTTRTPLENDIIARFVKERGGAITTQEAGQRKDLVDAYQQAILSKDQNRIKQAYQAAQTGGIPDKTLLAASKSAGVPAAKRLFHSIATSDQVEMLQKMDKTDMEAFFPYASKKAREEFRQWYEQQRSAHR